MKRLFRAMGTGLLAYCLVLSSAHANVIIAGTRVVFPASDGEVTLRLTNDNNAPALIEAWVDAGDEHSTPDKVNTPFLITPPLFRMEPHRDQSLRIIFTPGKQTMPADRESLFWLNVLEIPPKPSGQEFAGKNYLQLAIRSRLKLFYRPPGLAGDAQKAGSALTFKATASALVVHNPTPYYVTISALTVGSDGQSFTSEGGMVAPLADLRLELANMKHAPAPGTVVQYETINDYGAATSLKSAIVP
ncbi:fimbrial biogenesis chaperone [Dyella silvae]|uniref:fimbrial biogenesis chaperone n=1 Tax=Dyella silvae TaxID=2994424 RepID=UPI00226416AE|nr:molecular chaperone [Dyella silvae]